MIDVLDVHVLSELAQDVGDSAARRFADQYRKALSCRLERLGGAAAEGQLFAVYDTAASLAIASAMVGATRLARLAWAVTADVARDGTLPGADELHDLERLAQVTATALECHRAGGYDPR